MKQKGGFVNTENYFDSMSDVVSIVGPLPSFLLSWTLLPRRMQLRPHYSNTFFPIVLPVSNILYVTSVYIFIFSVYQCI